MNRPIKFRGKRKGKNPEWVFGDLSQWPDGNCEITTFIDTGLVDHFGGGIFNVTRTEVHPSTVGQFTGLTDRNKAEIFIGDDLKFNDGTTAVVVWDQVGIGLQSPSGAVDRIESKRELWRSEVIGNIHEPVNNDQ